MAKGVKTGGRVAGTPNKATAEFRQTITSLLAKNAENVDLWLQQVADGLPEVIDEKGTVIVKGVPGDPAKALDLLAKLAEYGAPKLNRTEVANADDKPFKTVSRIELVPLSADSKD